MATRPDDLLARMGAAQDATRISKKGLQEQGVLASILAAMMPLPRVGVSDQVDAHNNQSYDVLFEILNTVLRQPFTDTLAALTTRPEFNVNVAEDDATTLGWYTQANPNSVTLTTSPLSPEGYDADVINAVFARTPEAKGDAVYGSKAFEDFFTQIRRLGHQSTLSHELGHSLSATDKSPEFSSMYSAWSSKVGERAKDPENFARDFSNALMKLRINAEMLEGEAIIAPFLRERLTTGKGRKP